jgi:type IV pilus assembly protein PilX
MSMPTPTVACPPAQRGIVLIIALIMLVIISLLAAMSVRNATSSEGVSSNVRASQLASQAAEIALTYCEEAVRESMSGAITLTSIPTIQPMVTPSAFWQSVGNWDTTTMPSGSTGTLVFVIPAASVNVAGSATFSRAPECMVERLSPSSSPMYTHNFVVTARGFGPEVTAADSNRSRPQGSEAWMQSTIEIQ